MSDEHIAVAGKLYTVIAYCENPSHAWVMPGKHRGLTDGQAYVIDVSRATFLTSPLFDMEAGRSPWPPGPGDPPR